MNNFTFDHDKHEYRANGVILPSVTQIIGRLHNSYQNVPAHILQNKAEIGTAVHRAIELYESGWLDEDTLDPDVVGYFEAYKKARNDGALPEPLACETRFWNVNYGYAGTIDQVYQRWLNDIKICLKPNENKDRMQLTGYWFGQYELTSNPDRLTSTYLRQDGSYFQIDHKYDPATWLAMLKTYKEIERW